MALSWPEKVRKLVVIEANYSFQDYQAPFDAMTRAATPENEQFLLQIAECGTAQHMELLVRKYQYCKLLQEAKESDNWKRYKSLNWYQDELGMIVINARLPAEEGALVVKALEIIQAENRRKKVEEVNVDSNNVTAETFSRACNQCLDQTIDKNAAKTKWRGEQMDIQQALHCMLQMEG